MIEIMTFRLADGADRASFLAADQRLQTEFAYHQPGLARRTTAQAADGEWIVIDIWRSESDADACAERWASDPVVASFLSLVDGTTVRSRRYRELDG